MSIDVVHILPTGRTPDVLLDPEGIIKITGRAIDESRTKFSEQITNWIDSYTLNPASSTEVIIALEYLNSFNAIFLSSVLKKLTQLKNISIKWYIEKDDEDLLERANYISSALNIPLEAVLIDQINTLY